MGWDGDRYQQCFDDLAGSGVHVHGEADFVSALGPATVLDAGCGTGRVAIELAGRGFDVVGVDLDPSMLEVARAKAPSLRWVQADLAQLALGRTFDAVVLAGNVMIFVNPGTEGAVLTAL
ncbi:MAG: class I SAM-dependent methyltransferase, partial [Acidimicrobiales bacterium]